jgi:hypothetical protein
VYFGEFPRKNDSKVVGYAISGSKESLKRCASSTGFSFLDNFKSISLREKMLADYVASYTEKDITVCCDPTLLADMTLWKPLIKDSIVRHDYILTYYIRVNNKDRNVLDKKVDTIAKDNDLVVCDINAHHPLEIEDFISLIYHARFIVTDSFHGIVFSMLFHKCFNAVKLNDPHDDRYIDVLMRLGLKDFIIEDEFQPAIIQTDYAQIDEKLKQFREQSLDYLKESLK